MIVKIQAGPRRAGVEAPGAFVVDGVREIQWIPQVLWVRESYPKKPEQQENRQWHSPDTPEQAAARIGAGVRVRYAGSAVDLHGARGVVTFDEPNGDCQVLWDSDQPTSRTTTMPIDINRLEIEKAPEGTEFKVGDFVDAFNDRVGIIRAFIRGATDLNALVEYQTGSLEIYSTLKMVKVPDAEFEDSTRWDDPVSGMEIDIAGRRYYFTTTQDVQHDVQAIVYEMSVDMNLAQDFVPEIAMGLVPGSREICVLKGVTIWREGYEPRTIVWEAERRAFLMNDQGSTIDKL